LWKRELLQRIHDKNEAIRNKLFLDVEKNSEDDDSLVLNEHILKVT